MGSVRGDSYAERMVCAACGADNPAEARFCSQCGQATVARNDERRIVETFRPYVEARDWVSINRGTVVGFTEDGFRAVGSASEMGELS